MRPNHILFIILMTLVFAGSATSASFDSVVIKEANNYTLDIQETPEDDNNPSLDLFALITSIFIHHSPLFEDLRLPVSSQEHRPRLVSSPILPQAPPA